tara:strand:- start:132 stop:644 length:513 start_codon:yes stop_codon:yes gene_type:complete
MSKYLFYDKKKSNKFFLFFFIILLIVLIYFVFFYINVNQKYYIISNDYGGKYFIIPKDKEGEKVKFIDKKSINHLSTYNNNEIVMKQHLDLGYTIQLFSDSDYKNVENYVKNVINSKSEIISYDDIFLFYIITEIGRDYFVTYKSFDSKDEAEIYCNKLSFVKTCLIINP